MHVVLECDRNRLRIGLIGRDRSRHLHHTRIVRLNQIVRPRIGGLGTIIVRGIRGRINRLAAARNGTDRVVHGQQSRLFVDPFDLLARRRHENRRRIDRGGFNAIRQLFGEKRLLELHL